MRVGENEREKERSAAVIDWCLLGSSARDRSVLSLSHPRSRSRRDYYDDDDDTLRDTISLDVARARETGEETREDARSPLRILLGYGDVSRDAILARSLANYFVRPLACARLEARRVATLSPFSPLLCPIPLGPSFALCLSPRRSPLSSLLSCLSFSSLSFATLSLALQQNTPVRSLFPFPPLVAERNKAHLLLYVSVVSVQTRIPPRFARDSRSPATPSSHPVEEEATGLPQAAAGPRGSSSL